MKKVFTLACMLVLMAGVLMSQTPTDSLSKTSQNDKKSKTASPASKVALNPQPLPPGERKAGGDPASKGALNPQPLPPKERKAGGDPASKVALNPQPLPPKERKAGGDPASKVSLNPQPLPPKAGSNATQKVSTPSKTDKKVVSPGTVQKQ
ncbi:MAG TPA: hypothetical protein VGQ12_10380 [Candidatus Angelobacter sp.]|nr:hypothetical protein [Candidatus Angelobacter sp.]